LVEFANNKEAGLAYLSAARGLGFLGGPVSGQLFYNVFGYELTFVVFAAVMALTMIYSMIRLPSSLN
jgi:hypothetical protein